jgi:hypothetical protein
MATETIPAFELIRTAVLTDRGVAVNAVYKLLESLRALGADDRRDIRELLDLELTEQLG